MSDGDVARAALRVLADTPPHGARLQALLDAPDAPDAQTFDLGSTVAVLTAALVVLQLRVSITRDASGNWAVAIETPSASDDVVRALLEVVGGFVRTRSE